MTELLEILRGLKEEICSAVTDPGQQTILARNFDRATAIAEERNNVDYLRGKVEAYENTLGGKS